VSHIRPMACGGGVFAILDQQAVATTAADRRMSLLARELHVLDRERDRGIRVESSVEMPELAAPHPTVCCLMDAHQRPAGVVYPVLVVHECFWEGIPTAVEADVFESHFYKTIHSFQAVRRASHPDGEVQWLLESHTIARDRRDHMSLVDPDATGDNPCPIGVKSHPVVIEVVVLRVLVTDDDPL